MCDKKITQTPLKSRLFKFKSHPHGVFYVWHLLKSHYEKWVQKSPEALRHLGFLGWHPLRMHNMVAGMGFEPHDLRVMSPTSYQAALPRDIQLRLGVSPPHFITLRVIASRRRRRIVVFFASITQLENSLLRAVSLRKNDTQSFLLVHPTSYQTALPCDI